MNAKRITLVIIAISLTGGAAVLWKYRERRPREEKITEAPATTDLSPAPLSIPLPVELPTNQAPAEPAPSEQVQQSNDEPPPPTALSQRRQRDIAIWRRRQQRFTRLLDQLENEQNPDRRQRLIRSLAAHVRSDTLGTIEWAKGLQDPDEQYEALQAINRNSLSGIGARIIRDPSGYPRIAETTVLSAIANTGEAGPGDYIVGIVNGDGETVSFKDRSLQQVVRTLRGKPGSELQLLIKPEAGGQDAEPISVPIQRSMIVMVPPVDPEY